ncbi:putative 40S ribosomal protein S20 [Blattamonas nauphoetae]|uniref:40S ribosomal protein S20 n=1 Tax=Blattamonas nauphoetae TaxID=2049346 RepID=A0ABQ9XL65_9EUKA|nr:putative 40S ribosomal protein S20 [Blattamonas nauphoetae]
MEGKTDKDTGKVSQQDATVNKIRVTLTGRNHKHLERVSGELIAKAKTNDSQPAVKGPVRMPTKVLRITTRKTSCGQGSKTWNHFEMRIHKRVIEFTTTIDTVKDLLKITIDPGVDVDVALIQDAKKSQ